MTSTASATPARKTGDGEPSHADFVADPDGGKDATRAAKLRAIAAVRPVLDPLYKSGNLDRAAYKDRLRRAVQTLLTTAGTGTATGAAAAWSEDEVTAAAGVTPR